MWRGHRLIAVLGIGFVLGAAALHGAAGQVSGLDLSASGSLRLPPPSLEKEWPQTDFTRRSVELDEIISGGVPRDGIPAINEPQFRGVADITDLRDREPVIALDVDGDVRAYPLRIMIFHEIANDVVGGAPVAVTYCPLCNAAIVFDRRVGESTLVFGVTGRLRHSDLIMFDRQTESFWQQFTGDAIVGVMTGAELERLPARLLPFGRFRDEYPNGKVLVPSNPRAFPYGRNPYVDYDRALQPFLYRGRYRGPGRPLSYVIAVGQEAWLLNDVRRAGVVTHGALRITWNAGMGSALHSRAVANGRDIGFVRVERRESGGAYTDIPYDMTFAFAFEAFHPDGTLHRLPART